LLDVAVVGAGPAGSRTAYSLAVKGYSVAVLEKRPSAGLKTACTGIISRECLSGFDIPQDVVYRGANSAKIFSPSGYSLRIFRPQVQAYILNRSAFDGYLAGTAMAKSVHYYFNTSVEGFSVKADKVVINTLAQGEYFQLEARAVVLAAGFNTSLVRKTGLGLSRYYTTGAQVEVPANGLEEVEVYFSRRIAPGFFAWLVPTQNGRALAGLMTRHSAGQYLRKWLKDLSEKGKIGPGCPKIVYSGIPMYPLQRTYQDRLLVVGDAAGQVKPTTGGGIYFGLLCADIAADTLHKGLQAGNLSSHHLASYQRQWHTLLKKELRAEYLARRFYQCLNDAWIDKMLVKASSRGLAEKLLADNTLSFDWHGRALNSVIRKTFSIIVLGK
jgi:digeranylgeranylglycerophospholipid reductase